MRSVAVTASLFVLAACGAPAVKPSVQPAAKPAPTPAAPAPAPVSWPDAIRLPETLTAGDVPARDGCVVVTCTSDGALAAGGVAVPDISKLIEILAPQVAHAPGGAETNVVLAFDADVPWRTVAWTMQACADPKVMAPRIFFAVRHAPTGETGAFAAFLPKDGPPPSRSVPIVRLRVTANRPGIDATALAAWLASGARATRGADELTLAATAPAISLDPSPTAPLSVVLAAADAAARTGAVALTFVGTPAPDPSGGPWFVRRALAEGERWSFVPVGDLTPVVPDPLPRMAAPPRVRGGWAGFAESVPLSEEPPPVPR